MGNLKVGAALSVGEQPIKGLLCPEAGARMTLAECLTNLVFAPITDIKDIKMSGNWMWAAKCDGEGARLVQACKALCKGLHEIGCAIDGGKDSLSMAARVNGELVKSPGTIVMSAYVGCPDITKVITPNVSNASCLIYVRMGSSPYKNRLGGSALAQCYKQIGNESPDIEDFGSFVKIFNAIQHLLQEKLLLAGHDVSDGGLITALLEIAFASNIQLNCSVQTEQNCLDFWFAEESGVILAVNPKESDKVQKLLRKAGAEPLVLGNTEAHFGPHASVIIEHNGKKIVDEPLNSLRELWEETSDRLGIYQTAKECLLQEKHSRNVVERVEYKCNFEFDIDRSILDNSQYFFSAPSVAIIREEGSNGDREMAAAFTLAGFQTFDVTMTDLLNGLSLAPCNGIAFVGGFSYGDVLGSARGWAATIQFHKEVATEFKNFYNRADTFSFGVCNGCQLMAQLGWIGEYENKPSVFLDENLCGRFQSNFGPVRIEKSPAIMLKHMEGSVLGLWSSHGEGRFTFRNTEAYDNLRHTVAIRYVNGNGQSTEQYPWNPNGSIDGIAGMCSHDGRHLAIMPHSDRAFLSWQWPDYPQSASFLSKSEKHDAHAVPVSPWIKMFRNAFDWTVINSQ